MVSEIERSSFDDVFHDRFATTVRLAHLLTGSNDSAEDIAQEAFSRLHRHFDDVDNPAGFLHTATVNLCRNRHRGDVRESRKMIRHVENDPVWHETAFLAGEIPESPLGQLAFFIERIIGAQLLDAAMVVIDDTTTGDRTAARPSMSAAAFEAALTGRAMTFRAVATAGRRGDQEVPASSGV